jgi:hypothetical protein
VPFPRHAARRRPRLSKADEYIEKIITEAYKRELEREENVFRSLPFFATTLGVLATAIGLARPAIGPLDGGVYAWAIYSVLAATALATTAALVFLFQAIRRRGFKDPMRETDLMEYRADLQEFYAGADAPADATDTAVASELRQAMSAQLAEATESARENNIRRIEARSRAAVALLVAISLVFALVGLILTRDAASGGADHVTVKTGGGATSQPERDQGSGDRPPPSEAFTPSDAPGRPGSVDLPGGPAAAEGHP